MKLIVGLGNPGVKYESTRHNIGFMIVDHLLKNIQPVQKSNFSREEKLKSDISIFDYQPRSLRSGQAKEDLVERIILAKPLTYMNNSGMAVALIAKYYKVKPKDTWIVNDELDLPFGSMKIRFGGASAGHRGVDSIIASLGTDKFWRFRMGIGFSRSHDEVAKHKIKAEEYVLKNFHGSEKSKARAMIKRGTKAVETALEKGIEASQNQFNTK